MRTAIEIRTSETKEEDEGVSIVSPRGGMSSQYEPSKIIECMHRKSYERSSQYHHSVNVGLSKYDSLPHAAFSLAVLIHHSTEAVL